MDAAENATSKRITHSIALTTDLPNETIGTELLPSSIPRRGFVRYQYHLKSDAKSLVAT